MDFIYATLGYLQSTFGEGLWVIIPFFAFIGIVAQMRLYAKADQSAVSAIVPVWNVITFMKVIGRPAWHALYMIVPATVMFVCLMVDYQNLIAYSQGAVAFSAVAITLPTLCCQRIGLHCFHDLGSYRPVQLLWKAHCTSTTYWSLF